MDGCERVAEATDLSALLVLAVVNRNQRAHRSSVGWRSLKVGVRTWADAVESKHETQLPASLSDDKHLLCAGASNDPNAKEILSESSEVLQKPGKTSIADLFIDFRVIFIANTIK